jgi:hypothetical protein
MHCRVLKEHCTGSEDVLSKNLFEGLGVLDRGTIIWKEYPSLNEFRN